MKKQLKRLMTLGLVACLSVSSNIVGYAGTRIKAPQEARDLTNYDREAAYDEAGWVEDSVGWRWLLNGDEYLLSEGWWWLDGNDDGIAERYYVGADGYILQDTIVNGETLGYDSEGRLCVKAVGFQLNADGAWVSSDNQVHTKKYETRREQELRLQKQEEELNARRAEYDSIPGFAEYKQHYYENVKQQLLDHIASEEYRQELINNPDKLNERVSEKVELLYNLTRDQIDWLMENPDEILALNGGSISPQYYYDRDLIHY